MVKIPKDRRKGQKVIFRDDRGRFVSPKERYQKATTVQRLFRGKYHTVIEKRKVTPKLLVSVINQDEFEDLPANYADDKPVESKAQKYRAWDLAGKLEKQRGVRGKVLRVTMNIMDGKRMREVTFFHRIRRRGPMQYSIFKAMNEAIKNEGGYLYNRIGSKLLPDRKGKHFHLAGIRYAVEL